MLWKIKNFLFNLCKKKTILFVFFFTFLGLVYPRISSAFIVELAKKIAIAPFYYIVYVIVSIAVYIAGWAGSLLSWILSPDFISYSYTNPGGANPNPVIRTGLAVTQGFANMFLVLILVYIAIATILQLADYKTKRILVIFIVVALLVNFSPVICGLIVDASNIIMNFFIQDLSVDTFSETMGSKVANEKLEYWQDTEEGPVGKLVQLAVLVPFLFVLIFILLLFAVIFMLRYVAIWLLVILSPIAFICYILPITKKYFDQWWQQFLSWSFIGVTCGFFLYLALFLVMQLETNPGVAISTPDIPDSSPAFNAIMPYFVAIVFLGIGLVFGLATSAAGASTVVNFAKSKGRGTAKGVGRGAKWVGGKTARGVGRYVEEKAGVKEKVGKVSEKISKIPGARWFLPEKVKKYGEFRPAIDEAKAEAKDYKSPVLFDDIMTGAAIGKRAGGFALEGITRGDSEDAFNAGRRKFGKNLTDEELLHNKGFGKVMKRTLHVEKEGGYLSNVVRRDPRLAALLAGEEWAGDYATMTEKQAIQKATAESRSGHIANWEKQVVAKEHLGLPVTEKLMERGREPFENIARNVKEGVGTVQDSIDTLFSDYVDNILAKGDQAEQEIATLTKQGDKTATELSWEEFQKHFKTQHQDKEGFFIALQGQRFRDLGYRQGKYTKGAPPATPTAGAAAMGSPPPSPGAPKRPPTPPPGAPKRPSKKKRVIVTPPPGAPKTSPKKKEAQFKFMITKEMREQLKKKGYTNTDIYKMAPEEAYKILGIS